MRGGDLFDVQPQGHGTAVVLFADISSTSSASMRHREKLRASFRQAASAGLSPAAILTALNAIRFDIVSDSLGATFSSGFVATIDQRRHRICYASAGNEVAFIVCGGRHSHLSGSGLVLGIMDDVKYEEHNRDFLPDERLVLVSDGITQCRNVGESSIQFGTAGVVRALSFSKSSSCRSAAGVVISGADVFCGNSYGDDATVAVIALKRFNDR